MSSLLFCYTRYHEKSTVKLKTTFSQYLLDALLPWHPVSGDVYKQTRSTSFTFISTIIKRKLIYNKIVPEMTCSWTLDPTILYYVFCVEGFVVGFCGSSIYCLDGYTLSTIAVPQSAPMYQYLEKKMFRSVLLFVIALSK